ncbi:MAG TPA: cation transporter [Flavisolibacter sp.]
MKSFAITLMIAFSGLIAGAQGTKVSLQASGLTCSMCSKAVLNALQELPNIEKVTVDIKNQEYHISFKDDSMADFDALAKAVEDAGFSVASFKVTTEVKNIKLEKDQHVLIGNQYFHFLNADNRQLDGKASFTIVDKNFTTDKNFKKYSGLSKMECVQSGKASSCCSADIKQDTRIYHVII